MYKYKLNIAFFNIVLYIIYYSMFIQCIDCVNLIYIYIYNRIETAHLEVKKPS